MKGTMPLHRDDPLYGDVDEDGGSSLPNDEDGNPRSADIEDLETNDEPTGFVDAKGYEDTGWCYQHSDLSDLCRLNGKQGCVYALGPPVTIDDLRAQRGLSPS